MCTTTGDLAVLSEESTVRCNRSKTRKTHFAKVINYEFHSAMISVGGHGEAGEYHLRQAVWRQRQQDGNNDLYFSLCKRGAQDKIKFAQGWRRGKAVDRNQEAYLRVCIQGLLGKQIWK